MSVFLFLLLYCNLKYKCDVLRDLVPFMQFKNEKHPLMSVTFSKSRNA